MQEGITLSIGDGDMKQADARGIGGHWQCQRIRDGDMRGAVGAEGATNQRIAVFRIDPAEGDIILQVEEVVAVGDVQPQRAVSRRQNAVCDEGPGVVVLQLVIVGQWRAVGIEQTVGALVAVHLEAGILRGIHLFFVAEHPRL